MQKIAFIVNCYIHLKKLCFIKMKKKLKLPVCERASYALQAERIRNCWTRKLVCYTCTYPEVHNGQSLTSSLQIWIAQNTLDMFTTAKVHYCLLGGCAWYKDTCMVNVTFVITGVVERQVCQRNTTAYSQPTLRFVVLTHTVWQAAHRVQDIGIPPNRFSFLSRW